MDLFIKEAEINDAESITRLSNQLGYKTTLEETKSRLSEILCHTDHCIYLVCDKVNVIGWIHGFYSCRVESESFIEIGGMVVDENHRRKGIGKMLVNRVTEWTRLKKIRKIRVRCNIYREESHTFYNSIGFKEAKEQKIFDLNLN